MLEIPQNHTICPTCTGKGSIPFCYAAVPDGGDEYIIAKVAHNISGFVPCTAQELGTADGKMPKFTDWSVAKAKAEAMNQAIGMPNALAIFIVAQSMKGDAEYRFGEQG